MLPKTMSTQHPDNAGMPCWNSNRSIISNEDEINEAYLAYKTLNIHEVMWDAEGKDVDTHVIRKLFTRDREFFNDKILGKDIFLTYRVPNPLIEGAEKKILNETLNSIPLNYDVAKRFFGRDVAPVFEVIIPFTTDYKDMLNVGMFYRKGIVNSENIKLYGNVYSRDITGEMMPKNINVIPLIEDKESIFNIDSIIKNYCRIVKPEHMRVFIARSDPAMNYGMIAATLLSKYAVYRMKEISKSIGTKLYPIIGAGSSPFRGHLSPENIKESLFEYNSYYTFSIQSAFKYDYPEDAVKRAIDMINNHEAAEPDEITPEEVTAIRDFTEIYSARFQKIIEGIARPINDITAFLPKRRARKLHIGLFGYSRNTGTAKLPRAISFVGALYSIGIPPEIIGIGALESMREKSLKTMYKYYTYLNHDIDSSAKYFNYESLEWLKKIWNIDDNIIEMLREDMKFIENNFGVPTDDSYETRKHLSFSTLLLIAFKNAKFDEVKSYINEMALMRKFIG
ncbi:MAG: phosphoenolpyruvate carboxylase [Ferroplasma sp.]